MNKNQLQRRKRRKEEKERKGKKNYEEENKSIFIKLKISLLSKLNHSLSEHRGEERERKGVWICGRKNLFKSFLSFSVQIVHTPDFVFRSMYRPLTNQIAHMSLHANV